MKDIAPTIDAQTMEFHYGTHYKAYVDKMNKALGTAPATVKSSDLTSKRVRWWGCPCVLCGSLDRTGSSLEVVLCV